MRTLWGEPNGRADTSDATDGMGMNTQTRTAAPLQHFLLFGPHRLQLLVACEPLVGKRAAVAPGPDLFRAAHPLFRSKPHRRFRVHPQLEGCTCFQLVVERSELTTLFLAVLAGRVPAAGLVAVLVETAAQVQPRRALAALAVSIHGTRGKGGRRPTGAAWVRSGPTCGRR